MSAYYAEKWLHTFGHILNVKEDDKESFADGTGPEYAYDKTG